MCDSMIEDVRGMTQTRTNIYGRLQFLYTYPLPGRKLEPLLGRWAGEESLVQPEKEGLNTLKKLFKGITDWDSFVRELNFEYKRLLLGSSLAPPFASFYLGVGQASNKKEEELTKLRQMYQNL